MNTSTQTVATATLAAVIAMTILWAVVTLFQSRGAPMERLAAAERALRPACLPIGACGLHE